MSTTLAELSNNLASAVERAASSVVTVHGRPRIPSSGVVWRPGLLLTADAAIRFDDDLRVTLPGGETVAAKLKGRDPATDLALLACDTGTAHPANFSADTGKPGQIIVTIGRTADTGPIATMGIISGVAGEWQTWRGGKLDRFLRLDVSVYATSAGGAVADVEGNIFGIVAAGLSRSSVLAITTSTIERVAEPLSTKGRLARGYLGIGLQPVAIPEALQQKLGIAQPSGVMALTVEESGPAAESGVLMGDVVLSLGEHEIASAEDLHAALDPASVGKQLPLRVLRGGELRQLNVTVAERPARSSNRGRR
jgi:S1-C subfamily serine protease